MARPEAVKVEAPEPLTYNIAQAAKVLQLSERHLLRLIANGELPLMPHTGKRRLISRKRLAEWVDQHQAAS